jgi:hypothetical protein
MDLVGAENRVSLLTSAFMALRLAYAMLGRVLSWLCCSPGPDAAEDAEIFVLRTRVHLFTSALSRSSTGSVSVTSFRAKKRATTEIGSRGQFAA